MTDASLARLAELVPDSAVDVRRFRPNLIVSVDGGERGFVEQQWAGRRLQVGEAVLEVTVPCPRCVMTTLPVAELPKDPAVLRAIVAEAEQNLGVYAKVERRGDVAVGDSVDLL